ncbi:hypothetical protein BCU13_007635 [Vibrio lentus]|uniref:hypothetical protein n=1 Tax=Vibrio TaxID=662 RepID=UPI000C83ACCA|nr:MULTISPECIES: hypothetical protein [Vibrio]PMJ84759.1 hypothetical protein BCU13_16225 [Vibrio lentus]PMK06294.1 hypothetical protein BCU08_17250 [Vibrio splendidus]
MNLDVTAIQSFLAKQSCKVNNRYRTAIFTTTQPDLALKTFDAIKVHFSKYAVWDGFDTTHENFSLNANELLNKIKVAEEPGIIFYMPEEWQLMWGMRSKRVFMSALSMLSGDVPHMILICKAGDEFTSISEYYFKLIKAVDKDVSVFVPQRVEARFGAIYES